MKSADLRRLYSIAAMVLLAQVLSVQIQSLRAMWRTPHYFDDAYMFARYAINIRHGLGVSWNPDGVHTYGPTSLLWLAFVLALSYLPIGVWKALTLGSWLCSYGAMIALTWSVATNASSKFLSSAWRVFPLVALPLAGAVSFTRNAATGMETMLATLMCAVFVGLSLRWSRGALRPELAGLAGFLLFLTRPDAAIAVVLFPLLLFALMPGINKKSVATLLGVFAAGVILDLAFCKLYFHTALPLGFYMKSLHSYEGYTYPWHPETMFLSFLGGCEWYLLSLILFSRRTDRRFILCCLIPAFAAFGYLGTVTQIMGFDARYYVPYFPFFIVPALLVVDRRLVSAETHSETFWPQETRLVRSAFGAVVVLCSVTVFTDAGLARIRQAEAKTGFQYDPVRLDVAATVPLIDLDQAVYEMDFDNLLVAPLPRGVTVAATEVGHLGASALQVNIIDLAGLNDNEIALHGFDMKKLLARKPDVIWMPDDHYTYLCGIMLSDPALLEQYDLYAGAAGFGIALRKASPFRPQIDRQMQVFWDTDYSGYRMSDYLVRAASWTGQKHRVPSEY